MGRLLKLLFLKLPPSPSTAEPLNAFNEIPPRCRVPQAFDHPTTPSSTPASAALGCPQGRRKNDPFSPQARWGDDGARQVLDHSLAHVEARHFPGFALWHANSPKAGRTPLLDTSGDRASHLRKPCIHWLKRSFSLAVTPCKCYVEVGFFMLKNGRLSFIREGFLYQKAPFHEQQKAASWAAQCFAEKVLESIETMCS